MYIINRINLDGSVVRAVPETFANFSSAETFVDAFLGRGPHVSIEFIPATTQLTVGQDNQLMVDALYEKVCSAIGDASNLKTELIEIRDSLKSLVSKEVLK